MTCYYFNRLNPEDQLQYIYDHCRLVDFMIQPNACRPDAVCLYYDDEIFVEVRFDGLQGDRVKEIRSYPTMQQLGQWYNHIDISSVFQNVSRD